ncbi:hypothetical protein QP735_06910 [Curtobacterium citreum]|uniref:hypothetical protein n=1 Tax=Curtobacterium citreum TaxID=2036 RepID=UPI00254DA1C2|nr:hypothetical protein [Curtobacterium citreum]MDK8172259.1 hypothetical protein [Curtobacterium citreum]
MANDTSEHLRSGHFYVPWSNEEDRTTLGKALALDVAEARGEPLTVLTALKSDAEEHDEFKGLTIVSERDGVIPDGGVVLAWCPTLKAMEKTYQLRASTLVVVEWSSPRLSGWAKLNDARNAVTSELMTSGLRNDGRQLLHEIVQEGYRGWHDSIAYRRTEALISDLRKLGQYDRSVVLAYARQARGRRGIGNLKRVLDAAATAE